MAIIQAIAKQTFKRLGNTAEFSTFTERLNSLSGAYDVLLSSSGHEGGMEDVIGHAVAAHNDPETPRFSLNGPDIGIPVGASLALSLVIHELATNAAKYGALRHDEGKINIEWHWDNGGVAMSWAEYDGPPIAPPQGEGFGSILIKRAFPQEYHPETAFDFQSDGLKFALVFRLPHDDGNHIDAVAQTESARPIETQGK